MPPDIDAVSVLDARLAAAEGSSELCSESVLPSWIVLGICVGELFFGVELKPSFFENVLVRLVFSGIVCWGIGGGDVTSCWYISGLMAEFW